VTLPGLENAEDGLSVWIFAANTLNNHLRIADKGWPSILWGLLIVLATYRRERKPDAWEMEAQVEG